MPPATARQSKSNALPRAGGELQDKAKPSQRLGERLTRVGSCPMASAISDQPVPTGGAARYGHGPGELKTGLNTS